MNPIRLFRKQFPFIAFLFLLQFTFGQYSMSFQDGGQRVDLPNASALNFYNGDSFSIEYWIKNLNPDPNDWGHIVGKRTGCGAEANIQFTFDANAFAFNFWFPDNIIPSYQVLHLIKEIVEQRELF